MLDVHPPHEAAHTWKDFLIHIATICVGLLIAIGLEQTVEALHRHHERDALVSGMRQQAHEDMGYLREDMRANVLSSQWFDQASEAVLAAKPVNGTVTCTLPLPLSINPTALPSRSVWSIALAAGKVGLLPEDQAEAYERLDFEANLALQQNSAFNPLHDQLAVLTHQLHLPNPPSGTITIPAASQIELGNALEHIALIQSNDVTRFYLWYATADAIASGVHREQDIWPYLRRDQTVFLSLQPSNDTPHR